MKCSQLPCRREAAEESLDSHASQFPLTYHTHGCIDGAYLSSPRFSLVCTCHLCLRLSPCMHIIPSGCTTKTRGGLCFRKGFQAQGNASVSVNPQSPLSAVVLSNQRAGGRVGIILMRIHTQAYQGGLYRSKDVYPVPRRCCAFRTSPIDEVDIQIPYAC